MAPDFGTAPSDAEAQAILARCGVFMHGLVQGGEYAAYQFFIDYARLLASKMMAMPLNSPAVRDRNNAVRLHITVRRHMGFLAWC